MKRKSFILILVLAVSLVLIGCSGGSKEPANTGGKTDQPGKGNPVTSNEPTGGTKKPDTAVKLPEEFPRDLIPLLGDAKIEHVLKNDANKAINVTYRTGSSVEDAVAFYQEVVKDGSDTQEIVTDDAHIFIAGLDDHVVTIAIMSLDGSTIVQIDTRPE